MCKTSICINDLDLSDLDCTPVSKNSDDELDDTQILYGMVFDDADDETPVYKPSNNTVQPDPDDDIEDWDDIDEVLDEIFKKYTTDIGNAFTDKEKPETTEEVEKEIDKRDPNDPMDLLKKLW